MQSTDPKNLMVVRHPNKVLYVVSVISQLNNHVITMVRTLFIVRDAVGGYIAIVLVYQTACFYAFSLPYLQDIVV